MKPPIVQVPQIKVTPRLFLSFFYVFLFGGLAVAGFAIIVRIYYTIWIVIWNLPIWNLWGLL